jgi:predicted Zn-dependent protease
MRSPRFIIALLVLLFALGAYFVWRSTSARAGREAAYVAATPEQESALGLQAAPLLAERFGGLLDDPERQTQLDRLGAMLIASVERTTLPHGLDIHLLSDSRTVNALTLPGGQIFITRALLERVDHAPAQTAAILAHEIGHVLARHTTEYLARTEVADGLTGAAVLASYDPESQESRSRPAVAATIARLITMEHDEDEEIEADARALELLRATDFDMGALAQALRAAGAPDAQRANAFIATHPISARRLHQLEAEVKRMHGDTLAS